MKIANDSDATAEQRQSAEQAVERMPAEGPRLGLPVSTSDFTIVGQTIDTQPFVFGLSGPWLVMWSSLDGCAMGVARRVGPYWDFRMRGARLRDRTALGVISQFQSIQRRLVAQAAKQQIQ